MILTGDRNATFLHRLEQRRLGAWAGAIDLVGHQQLAEDRPRYKAEGAPPRIALLEHLRADDVGRHQIGRALNALVVHAEDCAKRLDQSCLGKPRDTDEQGMAAGEQRDQRLIDDLALTEDDATDTIAN